MLISYGNKCNKTIKIIQRNKITKIKQMLSNKLKKYLKNNNNKNKKLFILLAKNTNQTVIMNQKFMKVKVKLRLNLIKILNKLTMKKILELKILSKEKNILTR